MIRPYDPSRFSAICLVFLYLPCYTPPMSTLTFDTYESIKKLKAVGFTESQAEAQTSLIADLITTQIVTREYLDSQLKELRSDLQVEIVSVKSSLQAEIASLKTDIILLKWMLGIVMGGILALILKAFFPG